MRVAFVCVLLCVVAVQARMTKNSAGLDAQALTHLGLLKEAPAGGTVKLYYMLSPLFREKFDKKLAQFGLFHAGVCWCLKEPCEGPENQQGVEYNAKSGVQGTLAPTVEGDNIVWQNDGDQVLLDDCDTVKYWTHKVHVGDVAAEFFNTKLRKFIPNYFSKHGHYKLFNVKGKNQKSVSHPATTCMDQAEAIIRYSMKCGKLQLTEEAKNPETGIRKTVVNMFARQVRRKEQSMIKKELVSYAAKVAAVFKGVGQAVSAVQGLAPDAADTKPKADATAGDQPAKPATSPSADNNPLSPNNAGTTASQAAPSAIHQFNPEKLKQMYESFQGSSIYLYDTLRHALEVLIESPYIEAKLVPWNQLAATEVTTPPAC